MHWWWRKLQQSPSGFLGISILLVMIIASIFAPSLAPSDPNVSHLGNRLQPPGSPGNLLGTDQQGRDILSRIIYGGRVSMMVGFTCAVIAGVIGTTVGLLAGYYGGYVDVILMRIVDVQMTFPFMLLAILVNAILGLGLRNILITLIIVGWVWYARITRGEVLSLKQQEFVQSAVATGAGDVYIIVRHLLPNVISPLLVIASVQVAQFIVAEASISFLGFGIQPPTPAWGNMLAEGRDYLLRAWWLATLPGLALTITVLGVNLTGDWLRDTLDPTLRE